MADLGTCPALMELHDRWTRRVTRFGWGAMLLLVLLGSLAACESPTQAPDVVLDGGRTAGWVSEERETHGALVRIGDTFQYAPGGGVR